MAVTFSSDLGRCFSFSSFSEPSDYSRPTESHPTPDEIGKDFASLIKVIRTFPNLKNSRIVGPDVNIAIHNNKSFDSQCIRRYSFKTLAEPINQYNVLYILCVEFYSVCTVICYSVSLICIFQQFPLTQLDKTLIILDKMCSCLPWRGSVSFTKCMFTINLALCFL